MNDFEKDLKFEDWCVYVDSMSSKIRKLEGAIAASSENVINSLTLDGFGIYNCDIIQRMQNPVTVIAEFRNDIKKELACQNLYVIDKSRNGILQYNASTFSSVKRFTVEGDMNFSLIGITTDGAFCIADMNSLDFDAVERGEKVVIEMNDDVKRSIASVKEELGIN